MTARNKLFMRGAFVLLWMIVIYYFSDQPNSNEATENIFGGINYFVRKGAHMTEYAILFLLSLSLQNSYLEAKSKNSKLPFLIPFLFTVLYAITDEWHQSFVPGRSALASDVLIDSCGASIATLAAFIRTKL